MWYPHHNEVAAKEQGKLAARGPMKVIVKTLGGKGSKLTIDASETLDNLKAKAAKKLGGRYSFWPVFLILYWCKQKVQNTPTASLLDSFGCRQT